MRERERDREGGRGREEGRERERLHVEEGGCSYHSWVCFCSKPWRIHTVCSYTGKLPNSLCHSHKHNNSVPNAVASQKQISQLNTSTWPLPNWLLKLPIPSPISHSFVDRPVGQEIGGWSVELVLTVQMYIQDSHSTQFSMPASPTWMSEESLWRKVLVACLNVHFLKNEIHRCWSKEDLKWTDPLSYVGGDEEGVTEAQGEVGTVYLYSENCNQEPDC